MFHFLERKFFFFFERLCVDFSFHHYSSSRVIIKKIKEVRQKSWWEEGRKIHLQLFSFFLYLTVLKFLFTFFSSSYSAFRSICPRWVFFSLHYHDGKDEDGGYHYVSFLCTIDRVREHIYFPFHESFDLICVCFVMCMNLFCFDCKHEETLRSTQNFQN